MNAPQNMETEAPTLAHTWLELDRELSDLVFQADRRGQGPLAERLYRLRQRMCELVKAAAPHHGRAGET